MVPDMGQITNQLLVRNLSFPQPQDSETTSCTCIQLEDSTKTYSWAQMMANHTMTTETLGSQVQKLLVMNTKIKHFQKSRYKFKSLSTQTILEKYAIKKDQYSRLPHSRLERFQLTLRLMRNLHLLLKSTKRRFNEKYAIVED